MGFEVGGKAVCIDDEMRVSYRLKRWWGFTRPEKLGHNLNHGEVYTIVEITTLSDYKTGEQVATLHLAEAQRFKPFPQVGFPAFQFRPLRSTSTGMSLLRSLLEPTHGRAPVTEKA